MTVEVYAFRLAGEPEVRYVGQSRHGGVHRLAWQRSVTRWQYRNEGASEWARWLHGDFGTVEAVAVHLCATRDEAVRLERETIRALSALGHRLFNRNHVPSVLVGTQRLERAA